MDLQPIINLVHAMSLLLLKFTLSIVKLTSIIFLWITGIIAIPLVVLYAHKIFLDFIYHPKLNPYPRSFTTVKITDDLDF